MTSKGAGRRLSTRNLAAGFVTVVGAAGLGFPGAAQALLNNRNQYWGGAAGHSGKCANPGVPHPAPTRAPSSISNYGLASQLCGGGGAGIACVAINSSHGQHYFGRVPCATQRGHSVRESAIRITRGRTADCVASVSFSNDTSAHLLEGVSRRSFNSY